MRKLFCWFFGHAKPAESVDSMIELALSSSFQCERCKGLIHTRG